MTASVPALPRAWVSSVVAYDVDLGAPGVHRGLPGTDLVLVLPVDEPLEVSWGDGSGERHRGWSTLSGLHALPAAIHHAGHQRGVQVGLTVAGARALLGLPAGALARTLTTLDDVAADLGPAGDGLRSLPERLADLPQERRGSAVVAALREVARSRGADRTAARPEVARALARLTRGDAVSAVADDVGFSRRRLTSLVASETGLAAKEWQRVARFARSRDLLVAAARTGRTSLADVAAEAGYADQPHLSREWRRLAGCTPRTWLREEFPFVHDPEPDPGAA